MIVMSVIGDVAKVLCSVVFYSGMIYGMLSWH